MRVIGHLSNEASARIFGDYLFVQGIDNEIEPESGGACAIWIKDEDAIDQAKDLLERYRLDPSSPEYKRVSRNADAKRAEIQADEEAARKRVIKARQLFPGFRKFGAGPLTFLLISISFAVAYFSKVGENTDPIHGLFISEISRRFGWLPEVRHGEVWRVFTPMFIHYGYIHILFNMMWLFQLGSWIESQNGSFRFILMVLVIAGGSNLVQYFMSGPNFGGMSGVVYGLFAYVWIRGKFDPSSGFGMDSQTVMLMLIWLFVCASGKAGPIANGAHFGGLIIGAIWGFIAAVSNRPGR